MGCNKSFFSKLGRNIRENNYFSWFIIVFFNVLYCLLHIPLSSVSYCIFYKKIILLFIICYFSCFHICSKQLYLLYAGIFPISYFCYHFPYCNKTPNCVYIVDYTPCSFTKTRPAYFKIIFQTSTLNYPVTMIIPISRNTTKKISPVS